MNWTLSSLALFALFGSAITVAEGVSTTLDEVLTYDCARQVANLVEPSDQRGPVFAQGTLVFSSIASQSGSPLLIVSAGAGTYMIPLVHHGVNRIRFELPGMSSSKPQFYYLSYLHDNAFRSRVFEFSILRAPPGKDDLDYRLVQPQRAAFLQPHLEYAIWETSQSILGSVLDGSVGRAQVSDRKLSCEFLERKSPALARNLRHNLNELEMITRGPVRALAATRMPASVPIVDERR